MASKPTILRIAYEVKNVALVFKGNGGNGDKLV